MGVCTGGTYRSTAATPWVSWVAAAIFSLGALAVPNAQADVLEVIELRDSFQLDKVLDGFGFASAVEFAPDGRIFIAELLTGRVIIVENGQVDPTPFLEIDGVAAVGEQGLTGLVLDPNFDQNHYVYVYYTLDGGAGGSPEATWRWIQDNVFGVSCTSCHAPPGPGRGDLNLLESESYGELVNVPSKDFPGINRVEPGDPDNSYLVWKLEDNPGIKGTPMPPTGVMPQDYIDAIRQWIADGAQPENVVRAAAANHNRVVRYTEVGGIATNPAVLVDNIPAGFLSNGGSMAFGHDGTLFIQTGDALDPALPEDLSSLSGKLLRILTDGSIPADNPFVNTPGANPAVYAYGLRNGLGLAPDMVHQTSPPRVYISENGTNGNDELNLGQAGLNYGWPTFQGPAGQPGLEDPIYTWPTSTAPVSIAQSLGSAYPTPYAGDLFVALFRKRDLDPGLGVDNAVVLQRIGLSPDGNSVDEVDDFLIAKFDRTGAFPVELVEAPDGNIYFTLNDFSTGGELYRLTAVDADRDGCGDASDPAPGVASVDGDGDTWGADCDCDDTRAGVNPGATEIENNGLDDDCNPDTPDVPPSGCGGTVAGFEGAMPIQMLLIAGALVLARRSRRTRKN